MYKYIHLSVLSLNTGAYKEEICAKSIVITGTSKRRSNRVKRLSTTSHNCFSISIPSAGATYLLTNNRTTLRIPSLSIKEGTQKVEAKRNQYFPKQSLLSFPKCNQNSISTFSNGWFISQ